MWGINPFSIKGRKKYLIIINRQLISSDDLNWWTWIRRVRLIIKFTKKWINKFEKMRKSIIHNTTRKCSFFLFLYIAIQESKWSALWRKYSLSNDNLLHRKEEKTINDCFSKPIFTLGSHHTQTIHTYGSRRGVK